MQSASRAAPASTQSWLFPVCAADTAKKKPRIAASTEFEEKDGWKCLRNWRVTTNAWSGRQTRPQSAPNSMTIKLKSWKSRGRQARHLVGGISLTLSLAGCEAALSGGAGDETSSASTTSKKGGGGISPDDVPDIKDLIDQAEPFAPAAAGLRRITPTQYARIVTDLFGEGVPVPQDLEAIAAVNGSDEVGAASAMIQTKAAKEYERAAFAISEELFNNSARREALGVCEPTSASDACVRDFFADFTERAWRRPLEESEIDALVALVETLEGDLESVDQAFSYAVAATLLSPHFLYRPEFGEPDPANADRLRFKSIEMATRLSFALWGTTPDEELLEAGKNGDLLDEELLLVQAERLLSSPRADENILAYLMAYLEVDQIEHLQKNSDTLSAWGPELAAAAPQEAARMLGALLDDSADFRDIFRSPDTFMNSTLAEFYGVSVDAGANNYVATSFPQETGRVGLLGTTAWLARHAGSETPSPMGRGHAVRRIFLCEHLTLPENLEELIAAARNEQAGAVEEALADGLTLARSESEARMASPTCANCHRAMDPIGLALENFDAIGAFRETEDGVTIDPAGEIDGASFEGLLGLSEVLGESPLPMRCLAENLYSHLGGHHFERGEELAVLQLQQGFEEGGYSVRRMLAQAMLNDGFRFLAPHTP